MTAETPNPESPFPIPTGINQPIKGLPEVERIEPITEPSSQKIPRPAEEQPETEKIVDVPAAETARSYSPDPYRQQKKTRLGGSIKDSEGQATVERSPVPETTDQDRLIGAEQARRWFEEHGGPKKAA